MILATTTQKLQILLGGTVATNQLPVLVDYVQFTTSATTPALSPSLTNNTTAVDILAAPGASTQRKVNSINVQNADTAAVAITVRLNDNGTTYDLITGMSLAVGATLQYTDRQGWEVITRDGGTEELRTGWVQEFTANGTWYKPEIASSFSLKSLGAEVEAAEAKVARLAISVQEAEAEAAVSATGCCSSPKTCRPLSL